MPAATNPSAAPNDFRGKVPRDRATAYLRKFGAWTADELAAKTDDELAEVILWTACFEIRDSGEWFGLVR